MLQSAAYNHAHISLLTPLALSWTNPAEADMITETELWRYALERAPNNPQLSSVDQMTEHEATRVSLDRRRGLFQRRCRRSH